MGQARKNLQLHTVFLGHFNRAIVEHLCAKCRKLEHFIIGNRIQFGGAGNLARISRVNAVDIFIKLAFIRFQNRRDRNGAGIASAAAERGHIAELVHTLKSRNHNDIVFIQLRFQPVGINALDAGGTISGIGFEASLPAQQRNNRVSKLFNRHGKQRD